MSATQPAQWVVPDWPTPPGVKALVTTRAGGASVGPWATFNLGTRVGDDDEAVARNRALLCGMLPDEPVWLHQVHGNAVVDAAIAARGVVADAAVTQTRGAVCVVTTADCMPVLLAHRDGAAVGAAHAGWRGMAAGVIEATVARLGVPARETMAWLGPSISAHAFEVGRDVHDAFVTQDAAAARAFAPHGDGKFHADLYALARLRLARAGVHDVHGGGFCTFSDPARFYSYRRDGVTGRMAALIWIE